MLAIGLKGGIYDKRMIIDAFGDELAIVYTASKPFIIDNSINEKSSSEHDWKEFQNLAESIQVTVKLSKRSR